MNTQHTYSLLAAGVLACAVGGLAPRTASAQIIGSVTGDHHKLPVTAVGCLQRERDYRHEQGKRHGGFLHTNNGVSNEYILVNATMGVPSMQVEALPEAEVNACNTSNSGQAFELTGKGERDLEPFVGRRVVISGELKHAKHDPETVGTSGEFVPIAKGGGVNASGGDLEIREVNVDSFALAPIAPPPVAAAPEPEPAPAVIPEPAPEPAPVPQAPQPAPELPKTASPLPAIGLIGLFSLFGALGLRLLQPRTRPF